MRILTLSNKYDILTGSDEKADFLCLNNEAHSRLREHNRFLIANRTAPFLLEREMKTKVCGKCKQRKYLSEFYLRKTGKRKGKYLSFCIKCSNIISIRWNKNHINQIMQYRKKYLEKYYKLNPWAKTHRFIVARCSGRVHHYYKRGIKNFLTTADLKYLWFRDKAYLMKRPSIDRINSKSNYTLKNCRYIELIENRRQGGLISGPLKKPRKKVKIQ